MFLSQKARLLRVTRVLRDARFFLCVVARDMLSHAIVSMYYSDRLVLSLGGSKGDSDVEEGSPPRKRRKTPTRTSARSSPQVAAVSDKGAAAKSPLNTPYKGKGRKL